MNGKMLRRNVLKIIGGLVVLLFSIPIFAAGLMEEPEEGGIGGTGHDFDQRPEVNDAILNRPEIPPRVDLPNVERPENLDILSVPAIEDTTPQTDMVPELPAKPEVKPE